MKHELSTETDFKQEGTETAIAAFTDHTTKLENLDEKVKAMMSFSEHTVPGKGRARLCNICGKQGTWNQIRDHIESESHHWALHSLCSLWKVLQISQCADCSQIKKSWERSMKQKMLQ